MRSKLVIQYQIGKKMKKECRTGVPISISPFYWRFSKSSVQRSIVTLNRVLDLSGDPPLSLLLILGGDPQELERGGPA